MEIVISSSSKSRSQVRRDRTASASKGISSVRGTLTVSLAGLWAMVSTPALSSFGPQKTRRFGDGMLSFSEVPNNYGFSGLVDVLRRHHNKSTPRRFLSGIGCKRLVGLTNMYENEVFPENSTRLLFSGSEDS